MRLAFFSMVVFLLAWFVSPLAFAENPTYVGGEDIINGIWTLDQSPYYVNGTVRVVGELRIEAGVQVYFLDNYSIEVEHNAVLIANGGNEENDRILFTSSSITWEGINFHDASELCLIINCDIFNVETAVNCNRTDLSLESSRIEAHSVAVNCISSSPRIVGNHSIRVIGEGNAGTNFKAISIRDDSSPQIISNKWIECWSDFGNTATGIFILDSRAEIRENWIEVRSYDSPKGIDADLGDDVDISRNIIRVQSSPTACVLDFSSSTGVTVYNNDLIVMNGSPAMGVIGIKISAGSFMRIVNNIITGNSASIAIQAEPNFVSDSSGYNLCYNHDLIYNGIGALEGDIIEENPLFITEEPDSSNAYYIHWESPCRDNGYPDEAWNDPHDNSPSDIGRFWCLEHPNPVKETESTAPVCYEILVSYPNPFNNYNVISFELPSTESTRLLLFDANGRYIRTLLSGNYSRGSHVFRWNSDGMSAGDYIIQLEAGNVVQSRKVTHLP